MELLLRPWKMYADSTGRARRAEFWLFYVVKYAALVLALASYAGLRWPNEQGDAASLALGLGLLGWLIVTFVPSITLMARRLHDFDLSGKWCLTTFIPYIGFLAVIIIGLIPGTKGENDKGYDPREVRPEDFSRVFE